MRRVLEDARYAARSDGGVLILGETGVGKTWLARAIHEASSRKSRPFVRYACQRGEVEMFKNELFGHPRAAYTGADRESIGAVGSAAEGTLFLDDIGVLTMDAQPVLLELLDDGRYRPVGAAESKRAGCRIVAATNVDPEEAIEQKKLRQDLFERLGDVLIRLPPLRERPNDIVPLAERLVADEARGRAPALTPAARERFRERRWLGNVRELAKVVQQAVRRVENGRIDAPLLDRLLEERRAAEILTLAEATRRFQRKYLLRLLLEHEGNVTAAAPTAGVSVATLKRKIASAGLDVAAVRRRAKG